MKLDSKQGSENVHFDVSKWRYYTNEKVLVFYIRLFCSFRHFNLREWNWILNKAQRINISTSPNDKILSRYMHIERFYFGSIMTRFSLGGEFWKLANWQVSFMVHQHPVRERTIQFSRCEIEPCLLTSLLFLYFGGSLNSQSVWSFREIFLIGWVRFTFFLQFFFIFVK